MSGAERWARFVLGAVACAAFAILFRYSCEEGEPMLVIFDIVGICVGLTFVGEGLLGERTGWR